MNPEQPKPGTVFVRKIRGRRKKEKFVYTGTRREVKGVEMDFFVDEKGKTTFFYPSEVARDFKPVRQCRL